MSQKIAGTFVSGNSANPGQISDTLVIPSGVTAAKLNLGGAINASNTVKTQKSTNNGQSWSDVATYTSAQTNASVTVAHGEHWRLVGVAAQALKAVDYSLSVES